MKQMMKELFTRLTGLTLGPVGISWQPPELEVAVARRVIARLEDRRVLFNPYAWEMPEHCIQSTIEIRQFLSDEIGKISDSSVLTESLRAIRAACRKFMDRMQVTDERRPGIVLPRMGNEFSLALGELRAIVGVHALQIAVRYGIEIEGELQAALPSPDVEPWNTKRGSSKKRRST